MPNNQKQYGWVARQFHWLTVPLIIIIFVLGLVMTNLPLSTLKLSFYAWHKWLGLCVLAFVSARLIWRIISKPPTIPKAEAVPSIVHTMSKLGHLALYVLLLAMPLIGWLRSSTAGFEIVLFKTIPIPSLMAKNEPLSKLLSEIHEIGAWALLVLLLGHISAVVVHHKAWSDPILEKMRANNLHRVFIALAAFAGAALAINALYLNPPHPLPQASKTPVVQKKPTEETKHQTKKSSPWHLNEKQSKLEFTATQQGAKTTGAFKKMTINQLVFNSQKPEQSIVEVEIDIASLSLGNQLGEQTLLSQDWFNAEEYPTATYLAKGFRPLGNGTYQLEGTLRIKAITQPLSMTLKISTKETADKTSQITASGTAFISRLSYKIGQGEFASTATLADEIGLAINITVTKAH